MPATPQTASFHVSAVAAQRVYGDVRLLVRTRESQPFALIFTPDLADQIGLRVILATSTVPLSAKEKAAGPDAAITSFPTKGHFRSGVVELYQTINARILAVGERVNVSQLLRLEFPAVSYQSFMRWRTKNLVQERASKALVAQTEST